MRLQKVQQQLALFLNYKQTREVVSWKSRVLGKGFSSTGVYTVLPNRNGFSPK
jgi:hypothetical protein